MRSVRPPVVTPGREQTSVADLRLESRVEFGVELSGRYEKRTPTCDWGKVRRPQIYAARVLAGAPALCIYNDFRRFYRGL